MPVDDLTAIELRDRIAAGQISSAEATQTVLNRISQIDAIGLAYLATVPNRVPEYGGIV